MAPARDNERGTRRLPTALLAALASALFAVVLTGCPVQPPSPPPVTGCNTWSTNEQIFAALASLYFHEEQAAEANPIAGLPPLPVKIAAELIRCDPDFEARRARIRRAAISLAASVTLLRCRFGQGADVAQFLTGLAILKVPPVLVLKLVPLACAGLTPSQVDDAAAAVIDHTEQLASLQRTCCPCVNECTIGHWNGIGVADFTINVNRNSPCIFQAIDPQCWEHVCSANFDDTFAMTTQATCPSTGPTCRSSAICDASLPAPTEMSMPPTPTNPWCGLLSETVVTAAFDISSHIETVLKVQMARGATEKDRVMNYGLCESRSYSYCNPACLDTTSNKPCTPACPPASTCAVERDCGWATVEETSSVGYSELRGNKQLKFNSRFAELNTWTPFALKVMVTEVADATCRPSHRCPGQPVGACVATTQQLEAEKAPDEPRTCTCNLPKDSCTLLDTVIPKTHPAFCPAVGGE